jgi:hypothetical protein
MPKALENEHKRVMVSDAGSSNEDLLAQIAFLKATVSAHEATIAERDD